MMTIGCGRAKQQMCIVKDAYSKNLDGNEGGFEEGFHRLWKVKGEPTSQICSFGEFFTISCQLEIDF